ncbi:hypothetical protein [Candidatus Similichlamydia laticola]|uniref:Transmembrane protein n=1 Tax=Candidatus Similichlamydia laticola TaxID=2170265 RepID=A0A369KEF3_9BACT|nr:hypothetical protein [Candidatus Similichlamydia laticola]RDB31830.1 hypothetical protein HAT2_00061 [Candidatus Similichlamydia laticola]
MLTEPSYALEEQAEQEKEEASLWAVLSQLYLDAGIHLLFSGLVLMLARPPSLRRFLSISFCLALWGCAFSFWLAQLSMQRAHSILEQELARIRVNRKQAKSDLRTIFAQLGEPAASQFVDIISTDDFTFVKLLLSGRHGLHPHSLPHPSQHALAGFCGSLIGSACVALSSIFRFPLALFPSALCIGGLGGYILGKAYRNDLLSSFVWMASIVEMIAAIIFLTE